jgi:assimilatory nitrate reductase catalytic subunit
MTGQIGRPGTGPNSITGQCNAMGSRLYSNTTNLLGGREFESREDREEVAAILDISVDCIPQRVSRSYDEILESVRAGRIKALWIIATNTAHSWIDSHALEEIREKLDFLVVQDMYSTTETAQIADLVLPAAGWGEKDGSFINSERRIGRIRKLRRAPGQALADFQIFRLLADRLGLGAPFDRWKQPEDVFESLKALSRGRPCDISGIRDYCMLDEAGGIQWPLSELDAEGSLERERRLFADGVFPREDGRARFVFEAPRSVAEPVDTDFPLVLLTGRGTSAQWHTETRTGKSSVLARLRPERTRLQINPADASRLGLSNGAEVEVSSRRGSTCVLLWTTAVVPEGVVFLEMHDAETNRLTYPDFDPYSRQPSYKHCAVSVRAAGVQEA